MTGRIATATRLGSREQLRRPLLLTLLIALPFFFITRAITATEPIPRRIALPGGGELLTTMRELHGASMVSITIAFLAALCGGFIMRSARAGDRRLIVAGFRPAQTMIPRLLVLAVATTLVLAISLGVTALSFEPANWPGFVAGNLLVGLIYACIGALAGALLGQLGATYVVLFLAMLGVGILQNPMFGDGTPGGVAYFLPEYGAARVVIDGAFSESFHAWGELALTGAWLLLLGSSVWLFLLNSPRAED